MFWNNPKPEIVKPKCSIPTESRPDDSTLPKIPATKRWEVKFLDGEILTVRAHYLSFEEGMARFVKITGNEWKYSTLQHRWRSRNTHETVSQHGIATIKTVRELPS